MVEISIVSLIYKSKKFADWVYNSVLEFTPQIARGNAEFFFVANDPTDDLVAHLENKKYQHVVQVNPRRTEQELFQMGYGKPEYIHRVYRGWNRAILEAQGSIVVLVNSDNYFSPNWLENLLKYYQNNTVVCSQLVERRHPKYGSFPGAYHGEFGNHPDNFDRQGFLKYAERVCKTGTRPGGAFMPCMLNKELAIKAGLYPEGNIAGSSFGEVIGYGDEVFFKKLGKLGVHHFTAFDSIVYHLKEGEMEEASEPAHPTLSKSIAVTENQPAKNILEFKQKQKFSTSDIPSPLFSILVPTYNQAEYLAEALDSLLAQTYEKWEAIVVMMGQLMKHQPF
ncbi:MAG: glycosyltransferase [Anaerolineales bacterium]|nr:glycosyltransferase [Anaerolineales bacterium]